MTLAATAAAIEDREEALRRQADRRYAFQRMLAATDRVLWRLEELNRAGVKLLPPGMQRQIREALTELPSACLAMLSDDERVQKVLDSVFEVQEELLALYVPGYERRSAETEAEPVNTASPDNPEVRIRKQVAQALRDNDGSASWWALLHMLPTAERELLPSVLEAMEAERLLRSEAVTTGGRRYSWTGGEE